MSNLNNTLQINTLALYTRKAPGHVVSAIENASRKTGVSFSYLVQQAKAESNFNPAAKAGTSSATGLYQFIDRTWLGMIKNHGHKYGLKNLADKIGENFHVGNARTRRQILALRNNPEIAANMAAEFAKENKQFLEDHWGGKIGSTELYFAHFLGAGGAASFLKSMDQTPFRPAAELFPRAARANRAVFYDQRTGKPKTLAQVYDFFDKKFSIKDTDAAPDFAPRPGRKPELMAGLLADSMPVPQEKPDDMSAAVPIPAHKPAGTKVAGNNEAKDLIPRDLSNSLMATRSRDIRQEHMKNAHGKIKGSAFMSGAPAGNMPIRETGGERPPRVVPFQGLISRPVDLMLLSQDLERARDKKA